MPRAFASAVRRSLISSLPDDYYDEYRKAVTQTGVKAVTAVSTRYYQPAASLVVVAGDAAVVAEPLRKLAPVTVVDPENGFSPK